MDSTTGESAGKLNPTKTQSVLVLSMKAQPGESTIPIATFRFSARKWFARSGTFAAQTLVGNRLNRVNRVPVTAFERGFRRSNAWPGAAGAQGTRAGPFGKSL